MRFRAARVAPAILACYVSACGAGDPAVGDVAAYEARVAAWRAERIERLQGPTGFLNLVGLYWLENGTSRIGSAADNDIVFPSGAAAHIGTVETSARGVHLTVADGVDVRAQGRPVTSLALNADTADRPVTVTHGSFAWTIIDRDGRYALRLRDYASPAIAAFPGIESYPVDPSMRVVATLRPYDVPRVLDVDTVIEGLGYHPRSPGTVVFEIGGETLELEAYEAGDELFFVFADATSGRSTYPAGRFLDAALPGDDGRTILDFNLAYDPPCAFNTFATCPVASSRNRLRVPIEAGEKYDAQTYPVSAGHPAD